MNGNVLLILYTISVLFGIGIGAFLYHKPQKIEFKISSIDIFMFAFLMFLIITMVMVAELYINQWNLLYFNPSHWCWKLLRRAIDGGLLVAIVLPFMSLIFGKWIKVCNLDLCKGYSINAIKIYYSMAIVVDCIWLLICAKPDFVNDNSDVQYILNRVIIWMLNVGGTWFGIGFHCEGRIVEEIKNIKRSKKEKITKEIKMYSIPFLIAFAINCLWLLMLTFDIQLMKETFWFIYGIIMSGLIGMLVSVLLFKIIEYPSEKRSKQKLAKAISRANEKTEVKGRYQRIRYSLINEKNEKFLLIHKENIMWSGHEEEISQYFGQSKVLLEKFDYEECKKCLVKFRDDRKEYIKKGYISCHEDVKKQLIEWVKD